MTNHDPHRELMKETIRSVLTFSKYPIIVYCIDFPDPPFVQHERVIIRHASGSFPSVFMWKPWIICDSIEKGLQSGMYIEADDVITPLADSLKDYTRERFPICPRHTTDYDLPFLYMFKMGCTVKTQPYVHGHVLFRNTNLPFLREWFHVCSYMMEYKLAYDESVLNCLLWKYHVRDHYIGIIDPSEPDAFYKHSPEDRKLACMYHGCKDLVKQRELLDAMIQWYLPTCSGESSCQSSQLQTNPSSP